MSNATIIGSASEFNGVTTFKSQPVITSAILANTDSSTNIATTAWSNAFWTYVKTLSNTWSGTQTFSDVNASYFTLRSNTFNNTTNSCFLDTNQKTTLVTQFNIGVAYAEEVYIGNGAQLKKIVIGNTSTTAASEIKIGNSNSTTTINSNVINIGNSSGTTTLYKKAVVDGETSNSGTGIFCIKQKTGSYGNTTDSLNDPFSITSPSGNPTQTNITLGMGVDTTINAGYINCAMFGYFRPILLGPRSGNVYVGEPPVDFDPIGNSYTGGTYGNLVVSGNIYCRSPIIPKYSYPISSHPNDIPNQIGARGGFGIGGWRFYVIGDGNWRSYACYNNLPLGIYSVQFWMTPGVSSYTPGTILSSLYIRSTPFISLPNPASTTLNNIVETPPVVQYLSNPLFNFQQLNSGILLSGNNPEINQYVSHIIVYVDQPSIAVCVKATSSGPSEAYTEMILTRIA